MLKIGGSSKLTRINIRVLRHHNKIDLLIPKETDGDTSYRYYSAGQLPMAELVQVLRSIGFNLIMMKEVLTKYENPDELERFLPLRKEELVDQEQNLQQKMRLLGSTIKWLREDGSIMNCHVALKTSPERYVASVRQIIPTYKNKGMFWGFLAQETVVMNLQVTSPCYSMAIFRDRESREDDMDVEVRMSVAGQYEGTEHVTFKAALAVEMASVTCKGSYDQIAPINEAVVNQITQSGYEFNDPCFWIYHISPHETQSPEEYVTEICYPVKKK